MASNDILFSLALDDRAFKKAMDGANSAVGALKGALATVAAAFALDKVIDQANEADKSINAAAISMKLAGEYSSTAFAAVKNFAGALQDTTGVGDDTTLKMFALAQSFGLTTEQAQKTVKASIDLSKATGTDLATAVEQLSGTYNGHIGKLGKVNSSLDLLTEAQKKSGAAVDILGAQFAGTAGAMLNTFGGALDATKTRFGDLIESIGNLVVQNPVFIKALQLANQAFKEFGEYIDANSGVLKKFLKEVLLQVLDGLSTFAKGLANAVKGFKFLADIIFIIDDALIGMYIAFSKLEFVQNVVGTILTAFGDLGSYLSGLLEKFAKFPLVATALEKVGLNATDVAGAFAEMKKSADEFTAGVKGDELTKGLDEMRDGLAKSKVFADGMFDKTMEGLQAAGRYIDTKLRPALKAASTDLNVDAVVAGVKPAPKRDEYGKFGDPRAFGPTRATAEGDIFGRINLGLAALGKFWDAVTEGFHRSESDDLDGFFSSLRTGLGNAAKGFVNGANYALAGKEGATKLLSDIGAGVGEFLVPGLGQAVGPFIEALSKGPDFVKAQIEEFVQALPVLIDNIVQSIPVVVQTLADHAPEIVTAIANGGPRIAVAFATAFSDPRLYVGIAAALGQALLDAVNEKLTHIDFTTFNEKVEAMVEGVAGAGQTFGGQVKDAGTEFSSQMNRIGTLLASRGADFAEQFKAIFGPGVLEPLDALGKHIAEVASTLAQGVGEAFSAAAANFGAAMATIGQGLVDFLSLAFDNFADTIRQAAKDFIDGITGKNNGNGITQGKKILPKIAQANIDIATGGGFSAAKAAGVFGLTDGGGSSSSDAYLQAILMELRKPLSVTTTAEIQGDTLAKILLQLSRQNARTT
jgi:hypothetical protein